MEEEEASEWPNAIKCLSVQYDTSLLVCSSPLEARKVPMRGFLQTGNTNWNSLWKQWLPDFAWCPQYPALGGLSGNEEFKKALAKKWHDIYHNGLALEPVLYVLKCLSW